MEALLVVFGTFALIALLTIGGLIVAVNENVQAVLILVGIVLFGWFIFAVESSGG